MSGVYDKREIPSDLQKYFVRAEIGSEDTPETWVARLCEVFGEMRRVLRIDGVCFVNVGDVYAGNNRGQPAKPKDLIGLPWMLAFALRTSGWYLRSEIIWHKPNVMPESVKDRPTKAHEQVFMLTKNEKYFYDADAVREQVDFDYLKKRWGGSLQRTEGNGEDTIMRSAATGKARCLGVNPAGRNLRSVWSIPNQHFPGAHFATFPEKLVEPCVLAGTSEWGCCPACGAQYTRVLAEGTTIGWYAGCECFAGDAIPSTVLDPFAGSGTTGLVARRLGRNAILIELSQKYAEMARGRIGLPCTQEKEQKP